MGDVGRQRGWILSALRLAASISPCRVPAFSSRVAKPSFTGVASAVPRYMEAMSSACRASTRPRPAPALSAVLGASTAPRSTRGSVLVNAMAFSP